MVFERGGERANHPVILAASSNPAASVILFYPACAYNEWLAPVEVAARFAPRPSFQNRASYLY
jgi:hypothetical protein